MRTIARGTAFLLTTALVLAGCGGDDDPTSPDVFTVIVTPPQSNSLPRGQSVQLSAVARDAAGNTVPGVTIAWNSSAETVLEVTASGRLVAIAPGNASVTASVGSVSSAPLQLTVTPSSTVAAVVRMTPGNQFLPSATTVSAGQTVVFSFPSVAHNVVFEARPGAPQNILPQAQDQTVSRAFSQAGTFPYLCTLHSGMNGQIVVNP